MAGVLTLHRVSSADSGFLATLATDRWVALPLPELAAMQDRAQRGAYTAAYGPDGEHLVLLDGQAVGRVWWSDQDDVRYIVDLALLSSAQRQGLGGRVFRELIAGAAEGRVRCTVDRAKVGWHHHLLRLGFIELDSDDLNVTLERPPAQADHPIAHTA